MRNLLETSSVAQSLDGAPSDGEPAFPRIVNSAMPEAFGEFSDLSSSAVNISHGANSPIPARAE